MKNVDSSENRITRIPTHRKKKKKDRRSNEIYKRSKDIKNTISETGILNRRIFDKFKSCKSYL